MLDLLIKLKKTPKGHVADPTNVDWKLRKGVEGNSDILQMGSDTTSQGEFIIKDVDETLFDSELSGLVKKYKIFLHWQIGDKEGVERFVFIPPAGARLMGAGGLPPPPLAATNARPQQKQILISYTPPDAEERAPEVAAEKPQRLSYDIAEDNRANWGWDWIIWETEGNSSPKYQRGGRERKLGLYALDYDKLRKAGGDTWQPPLQYPLVGGGWVKIALLESMDYSDHAALIRTFLPDFPIEGGKVKERIHNPDEVRTIFAHRLKFGAETVDTVNTRGFPIILPFNYDDNGFESRALGKILTSGVFPKVDAYRMEAELPRWATASRSTIAAFPPTKVSVVPHATESTAWQLRPYHEKISNLTVHPECPGEWLTQIRGPNPKTDKTLTAFQAAGGGYTYYSVKTGVQFVSLMDQTDTSKDKLEENSIHAMNRSNLIHATIKRIGVDKFKARYQIEVLCILLTKDPETETKLKKLGDGALENRTEETDVYKQREAMMNAIRQRLQELEKLFAPTDKAAELSADNAWADAEGKTKRTEMYELLKQSRDKAHMQQATIDNWFERAKFQEGTFKEWKKFIESVVHDLNAENNKDVQDRKAEIEKDSELQGWDGIQIREISNAAQDAIWFPALSIPSHGKVFVDKYNEAHNTGDDWVSFWEERFAKPLGEAKGEMLLYFGMQHMTSNAQNFLVAFDKKGDGPGAFRHLILRDIGDTLYNDHVFDTLKTVHDIYRKEWDHESNDEFGVTLQTSLGEKYTKPEMTRIGASIVFFFGPFLEGDLKPTEENPDAIKIVTRWSLAHNMAFLDYMRAKIGYHDDWRPLSLVDKVTEDFKKELCKSAVLNKKNSIVYPGLVKDVIALSSRQRWDLIKEIVGKCENPLLEEDEALGLVNAHEILICAEVQGYLKSVEGAAHLKKLHGV